ncbi:MAG: hypothetical protein ACLPN1_18820, partial [Dissulfurispiraceae bacterium]
HEEICSGWSIFGYQNPALLVNFRLSKPDLNTKVQQDYYKAITVVLERTLPVSENVCKFSVK